MNMHVHVCVRTRTRTCAHMWQGVQVFELRAWSQLECEVLKKEGGREERDHSNSRWIKLLTLAQTSVGPH